MPYHVLGHLNSTSMEQNVTNSTETECQQQIGKPGNSQHQSVESQNDNSEEQVKPSNVASLEAMNEDVICIEDEGEELVSSKTENKTALDKICCIINSAIEQDVTRSQTPESPSVSGGLQESGVNTVLSNETQPSEIKSCKVCNMTDGGKKLGGPACNSCSLFFKKCVEDGIKITGHTVGATVCHCQLCRLLRCYYVGMEPKDSSFVVCLICGKPFLSWYFLKQHVGKCKKSTFNYYCTNCEREFVTECQHRLHKKSGFFCKKRDAGSILKYKCDICWRSFSSLGVLIMHRYTHIKLDREMLEMENSLEMHPFHNDPENPIVINDSNSSKARGKKQGDTGQGKKLNKNQMTLLSQLDCSIIDINQDEYLCLQNSSDPQCQKPENCDEIEDSQEILKPESENLESRNTTQIVLSHEKNFWKDDTYVEKKTDGEGESSQDSVSKKEKYSEPLDSCNGIRTLRENQPTIINDKALQGKDNRGPGSSVTETKTLEKACSEILSKSETMKDDLLIDDEEDENDYILVDFDSSDEDEKDGFMNDKNDSSENLETLPKLDAFTVKNETMCDSLTKTTSTTEQEVSSPALIEEEFRNPTLNYSTGGDDQLIETLPDYKDQVEEEILINQSNGEIINQSNGEIKKNLSESKVPVNIKQESADLNEFSASLEQNEWKSQSSSLNADTTSETSTSQSDSILELISAVLPSSSGENSLTSHQSRIQSLINQLGLKSKVKVTSSEDGTKKVELHFIVNDKLDLESQWAQTNDGSISSTSKDTSNDEVSSTVPDDVDQHLASNGHSSSEQSLLSQIKQAPMKEPQTKEEALSSVVSSTEELKEETITDSAKLLDKEYESGMDKMNTKPPLEAINESKMYEESKAEEVATPDVIILSSDEEEESPVDSTKATTSPISERPQEHLEMQPSKEGFIIVDNSSAEKETEQTDVTSKENLPESEKCIEESNSADKFSLIRKYLNAKQLELTEQPSVFSKQDSLNGKRRLSLKPAIPAGSGQKLSCTAGSSQENNSKIGIESYKCYLCPKIYLDPQKLKLHLHQSHSYYQYNENDSNNFRCCHCGDEFDSVVKVSIHEMSVHGLRYSCPFCGVFQRSHEQFLKHFICHFSLLVYYCNSCNREFSKHVRHGCPTSLSSAMKCFLCDRIFFDKEHYCNHTVLKHSQLFKFTCKACLQNFGTPLALKVHRSSLDNTLDGAQVNIADTITLNANSMEVTVLKETPLTAMHRPYISTPLTSNKQKTTQEAGDTVKSYGNHASLDLSQLPKTPVSIGKKGELASNIGKKGELASNIGKKGELAKTCTAESVDSLGLPKITRPKKSIPYKGRSATSSSDFPLLVKKTSIRRIQNMPLIMKNVYKCTFTGDVEIVDKGDDDVETETQNKSGRDITQQIRTTINGQKVTITESKHKGGGNAFIPVSDLPNLHMLQSNRMSEKDCHASLKRKIEDSGSSTLAISNKQGRQGLTVQGDQISAMETDDPQNSKSIDGRNSTDEPDSIAISLHRFVNSEIERAYHVPNNGFPPEVILLDEDEPGCSVTSSPGAISSQCANASTPCATESLGVTSSTVVTASPGATESLDATSSTPGATKSPGATSSTSATVSPGESREDSSETPSSGDLSKEGKSEERLLSQNLHKRVPERKKRGCENLSEEVEGVISNLLQFWKKSETITKPTSTNKSTLLTKKFVPTAMSFFSQEDKTLSAEVKSFLSNQQSDGHISKPDEKKMKRKTPLYENDDIKRKRISEDEEKGHLGSISSGVDTEPTDVVENNTSSVSFSKEKQNMFITKSVLSVIKSNPTLLEESHEILQKKALLPMHPYLKEFTKMTKWKSSSPINALASVNALLHRRVPVDSLSKPPFSNHDEGQINNQKQKIFSDIIATLERIESLKYVTSKETVQKLEAELSKRKIPSEENTSVKSTCNNDMASRDTMQKLKSELSKRTTLSEEQTSVSEPTARTNSEDSEANKRYSVSAPTCITKTREHQIEKVNNLVEKQVSISEPVSKAPINQNEENGLTDGKATVYKPVSKAPVNHTKSDLEDAVKRLSSVVQSISKGKIKEFSIPESDENKEAKKGKQTEIETRESLTKMSIPFPEDKTDF